MHSATKKVQGTSAKLWWSGNAHEFALSRAIKKPRRLRPGFQWL